MKRTLYLVLFTLLSSSLALFAVSASSCAPPPEKEEWRPTGRTRREIAQQFDNYMSRQKVLEVWGLGARRLEYGIKHGGHNFFEVWVCEDGDYYEFALFVRGKLDMTSMPTVKRGRWNREPSGQIRLEIPIKEWRAVPRKKTDTGPGQIRKLYPTGEVKFVEPKEYLWESGGVYSPPATDRDYFHSRSLLKKLPLAPGGVAPSERTPPGDQ